MKPKLVKGTDLTPAQKRHVLAAYIYRWTVENMAQATRIYIKHWGEVPQIETITDEQWLAEHAFYITKAGELALRPSHCEPAYLAD